MAVEILMTNTETGQTVSVVKSAFDLVWSKRGWEEAAEGATEDERVLGLGPDDTIEAWKAKKAGTPVDTPTAQVAPTRVPPPLVPPAGGAATTPVS